MKMNMETNETCVVKLDKPIHWEDEMISELVLREPKALDMRNLPLDPKVGDFLDVASKITNMYPQVINQLCVNDMWKVVSAIGNFTPSGQEIGKTS